MFISRIVRSLPVCLIGLLAIGYSTPAAAQTETERVFASVDGFFDGLSMPDTLALAQIILRDGQFYSIVDDPENPRMRPSPHASLFENLAENAGRFLERGWNPTISIHGRIATVTTPYDFYVDGAFSHCGTDVFNLLKSASGWKISGVTYTVERTGCADSPLGSPYVYQGVRADLPTGASRIIKTGLVSAYDMQTLRDDGRLMDFGSAGNHGEIERMPSGAYRTFDTVADRIYLPENQTLELNGPLSIALRIRVRELGIHQHIIACDDKFALWITPENKIRLSDSRGHGVDTVQPIASDEWLSLVAVYDGTTGDVVTDSNPQFYINGTAVEGTLINRDDATVPLWNPGELFESDACYIGFESHQGLESHVNLPLVADIDDLLIFSRVLSAEEASVHATWE